MTGASEARNYSSSEVVRFTGITARQLQWWDEQGIVVPERDGRNRAYSFADLAELAVIAELRGKGFSLQGVRKVMRFLKKELGRRLADVVTDGGDYHLLTDGRSIYLESSAEDVVDVLKNSRQALFGVCLSDTVLRLGAEVRLPVTTPLRQAGKRKSGKKHPTTMNGVKHGRATA